MQGRSERLLCRHTGAQQPKSAFNRIVHGDRPLSTPSNPLLTDYGRQVFVCAAGNCVSRQSAHRLLARFNALSAQHGLQRMGNPHRVRCFLTSCLGVCSSGPIMVVYPEGIWYHSVDEATLEHIFQEHLVDGKPVEELIFHRHYPTGTEPAYAPDVRGDPAYAPSELELMAEMAAAQQSAVATQQSQRDRAGGGVARRRQGAVLVYLGEGASHTAASVGTLVRAWGRNLRVAVLSFGGGDSRFEAITLGETQALQRMGVEWSIVGEQWDVAQEKIASDNFDLLVLDGLAQAMHEGRLDCPAVINWLRQHKPPGLHLIISGSDAPLLLREYADAVVHLQPPRRVGRALPGIDF